LPAALLIANIVNLCCLVVVVVCRVCIASWMWWAAASKPGAQEKKKHLKPPGRKPRHKKWDEDVGEWVDDPDDPPPVKKPVGRPKKRTVEDGAADEPLPKQAATVANGPVDMGHTRKFQKSWLAQLTWLIFAAGVSKFRDENAAPVAPRTEPRRRQNNNNNEPPYRAHNNK
jgi:hypothetical protein